MGDLVDEHGSVPEFDLVGCGQFFSGTGEVTVGYDDASIGLVVTFGTNCLLYSFDADGLVVAFGLDDDSLAVAFEE